MEPSAELTSIPWAPIDHRRRHTRCDEWRRRKSRATARQTPQGNTAVPGPRPVHPKIPSATGEFATGEREPITPQRAFLAVWPTSPEPQPQPQPTISYSRRVLRCTRDGRGALGAGPSNGLAVHGGSGGGVALHHGLRVGQTHASSSPCSRCSAERATGWGAPAPSVQVTADHLPTLTAFLWPVGSLKCGQGLLPRPQRGRSAVTQATPPRMAFEVTKCQNGA